MLSLVLRLVFLTAMSVAFCGLTAVLGSAPLVVLRNTEGRARYIVATLAAVLILFASKSYGLAIPFALSAILVYTFIEALELGADLLKAGLMAVSLSSGVTLFAISSWAKGNHIFVGDFLRSQIKEMADSLTKLGSTVPLDVESMLHQTPSVIVILMAVSLWLGAVFGKRFSTNPQSELHKLRLRDFDLPDFFIWFFILALPGTFLLNEGTLAQIISVNVFNFVLFLYFLKGLSIVAAFFQATRTGPFWRGILYLVLITQLFLIVSALGVGDVWLNFKARILKKSAESMRGDV